MFLESQTVHQTRQHRKPILRKAILGKAVRSTSMKKKSLIETVPMEARDFTGASAPKPQSPVLVPQTFRLPQRLIDDLVRAGELRALSWLDREGNTWLPINQKSTVG
jgi:hypothetical protein